MRKSELIELVKQQAAQIAAQNKAHEREIKILLDTLDKLKGEPETPRVTVRRRTRGGAAEAENVDKPGKTLLEARRERVLELFKNMPRTRQVPGIEEFVKENSIMNLDDVDDATFTVLIRQHLNREIADAYAGRKMNMRVYRALVHYFDDYVDEKPLEVAEEFKAELERLRADAAAREEERKRLKPTDGPFRLRGREELEKFLNEQVVDIVNRHAEYSRFGVHFPKGFILEGKPGCGKTFAVERLAEHLKWHVVRIDSGSIGSSFIHATARKIQEKFQEAAEKAPSIVIIDEMEAFTRNRANLPGHNTHSAEEVDSFLQCLQTAAERRILVAGMTNHIETIDPAILRTGRLGAHIKVDMPSLQEVEDVLAYALAKLPHAEFDLHPHAERLLDHPLSDVTHAVDESGMNAARAGHERIEEEDLAHAIDEMLRRQSAEKPGERRFGFAE
ncbi:MAG: ATP-binding protein [Akkermansia sp.]|nr:ATP-binding protein [Akkermansia sp.]